MGITRRDLCLVAGAGLLLPAQEALAKPQRKKLPALAISVAVAELDGKPVVSDAWLAKQLSEVQRLMSPHGVVVEKLRRRKLPEAYARLENAKDRDALATFVEKKVINAFFVKSLRDVDNPEDLIQGVRWRLRRDLRKDYVIVASNAGTMTLTHELGHYFGNGHSYVVNNIMSYLRDDPAKVAFNKRQAARMRTIASRHLRRGKLVSIEKLREEEKKKKRKKKAK